MGRPKEHNEQTAIALLDAAERIVEREGMAALSVRRVANEVGTTTRAVYSLFGAKDGLVAALGVRAFDLLGGTVSALPLTSDPLTDLVQAGLAFRRFVMAHPVLFRIGVQRVEVPPAAAREVADAADRALAALRERLSRLQAAGRLGDRTLETASWEFHALCEGLAIVEARCGIGSEAAEQVWMDALSALLGGWALDSAGNDEMPSMADRPATRNRRRSQGAR